jgi:predicted nuclease with TOPRIM domain
MTDVAARLNAYIDLQLPSTFRWRYGRIRSAPARVPELAPNADRQTRHRREDVREFHRDMVGLTPEPAPPVTWPDELRIEIADLKAQIPALQRERDGHRIELVDLKARIPILRQERDELLATAVSLSAEMANLSAEIQALRERKSSLERSIAALRWSTEKIGRLRIGYREFHDS